MVMLTKSMSSALMKRPSLSMLMMSSRCKLSKKRMIWKKASIELRQGRSNEIRAGSSDNVSSNEKSDS